MVKLAWDQPNERLFSAGVDRGVFYPQDGAGVSWNGLISFTNQTVEHAVETRWIDGLPQKYERYSGDFAASIECITYPKEFELYDGVSGVLTGQAKRHFGMSYRNLAPDDDSPEGNYHIHLLYNVSASPSERSYATLADDTDPIFFGWDLYATPVEVPTMKPSAHIIIDTRYMLPNVLPLLEAMIYGDDDHDPRLPMPKELYDMFEENALFRVIDNGDGTWTAISNNGHIQMLTEDKFQITVGTAKYIDSTTYKLSSY